MTNPPQDPTKPAIPDTSLNRASRSLAACDHPFDNHITMADTRDELLRVQAASGDPHTLLALQAHVLDALFNRMLAAGFKNSFRGDDMSNPRYINSDEIQMALRAQRQCARTLNTLSLVERRQKFASELIGPKKDP